MTNCKSSTYKLICIVTAILVAVTTIPFVSFGGNDESTGNISSVSGRTAYTVDGKNYTLLTNKSSADGGTYNCEYFYTDGYFMEDPAKVNSHLATLSMTMTLASHDYSTLEIVLEGFGFDDFEISTGYKVDSSTEYTGTITSPDTIAPCLVATKELEYLDGTSTGKTLVAVIPRTGTFGNEWALNFTVGTASEAKGESTGISEYADGIAGFAEAYIENNQELAKAAKDGDLVFWVTGQSRGGTIANLVARRLVDEYTSKTIVTGNYKNPVYAYCMAPFYAGSEAAMNENNTDLYTACIHNFETDADLITKLIPYLNETENKNNGVTSNGKTTTGFVRYGTTEEISVTDEAMYEKLNEIYPSQGERGGFQMMYLNLNIESIDLSSISDLLSIDTDNLVLPLTGSESVTMNDFENAFMQYLNKWVLPSRDSYASAEQLGTGYTRQEAITTYINIIGGLSNEKSTKVLRLIQGKNLVTGEDDSAATGLGDVFSNAEFGFLYLTLKIGGTTYETSELVSYINKILKWDASSGAPSDTEKKEILSFVLTLLNACKASDGTTIKTILGDDYTTLEKYFPVLGDLLLDFVYNDYAKNYSETSSDVNLKGYDKRGILTTTLLYNIMDYDASIIYPHYPAVYEASLVACDSFYNDLDQHIAVDGEVIHYGTLSDGINSAKLVVYKSDGTTSTEEYSGSDLSIIDVTTEGNGWELFLMDNNGEVKMTYGSVSSANVTEADKKYKAEVTIYNEDGSVKSSDTTDLGSTGGVFCIQGETASLSDSDIWVKKIVNASGNTVEYQAHLPSNVVTALVGVYDESGRMLRTEVVQLKNSGNILSVNMEGLGVPEGGSWKIFSTDASYVPQNAAASGN